jgi:uncharacterized membrane protein YgdD (TMEM256/DUF423 family)
MPDESYSRLLIFVAGVLGAAGVAMAAGAAHSAGAARLLARAAALCLVHAPTLLALAAHRPRPRLFTLASALIGGGTIIFAGDLAMLALENRTLFQFAAPTGGTLMILGWVLVALAAFTSLRR